MNIKILLVIAAIVSGLGVSAHKGHDHSHIKAVPIDSSHIDLSTPWNGKRIAFLGDSMTDPANTSSQLKYWNYLDSLMGIRPAVFARSGFRWDGIYRKAVELHDSISPSELDAIFIWAGTNDWNGSVPPGSFYTETLDSVSVNGQRAMRLHRHTSMTDSTFCGNINRTLAYLKTHYPTQLIVVMTPIHRGYARFSARNEQPSEEWSNAHGLFIDDYVNLLMRGARLWSVPVIDLFGESGIMPDIDSNTPFIHDPESDRLHPSDIGHYRIARIIQSRLKSLGN